MPGNIKLKLYLDSSVLLSLLRDEEANGVKLGENVARLLREAAEGKYQVLVSEHAAAELVAAGAPREYVDQVLRPMLLLHGGDLLVANESIIYGALKLSRTYEVPMLRALHVVFAQRNNALLVTRDTNTMLNVRNFVGIMSPEDLISMG
ncbi:PIN domain-containing protein [Methanocella sp. MCL-LM]|uniref:PIN domain-containing protein n=1 Tax=Methanocella sp. MCL-LM TaxID=3412035 RepID=UPI003C74120D